MNDVNSTNHLDVVGIGNAIVDTLVHADEQLLDVHSLTKGSMQLIDRDTAVRLSAEIVPAAQVGGGSVANTIAGLASLGARCGFLGKVSDDETGRVFRDDLRRQGVHFPTAPADDGSLTARCLVLVTPDAQRTMATFLGACHRFGVDDIDEDTIRRTSITFLEGYLFDPPGAKQAFRRALELAHRHGNRVALTLSDPFCVGRHREDFLDLVQRGVNILFANEAEIVSLLGTDDMEEIARRLEGQVEICVVTRSERGSIAIGEGTIVQIPPKALGPVIDTTGAGDLYASGFLFGLARGMDLQTCGALGSLCAGSVITHYGSRPQSSLRELATRSGLL